MAKEKETPTQYVNAFNSLISNDDSFDVDDDYYIWKYFSIVDSDEEFNSWDIYVDAIFNLIDDNYRQRITSKIIDDIDRFVKDVERLVSKDSTQS